MIKGFKIKPSASFVSFTDMEPEEMADFCRKIGRLEVINEQLQLEKKEV